MRTRIPKTDTLTLDQAREGAAAVPPRHAAGSRLLGRRGPQMVANALSAGLLTPYATAEGTGFSPSLTSDVGRPPGCLGLFRGGPRQGQGRQVRIIVDVSPG
jgi:hypothetical protein